VTGGLPSAAGTGAIPWIRDLRVRLERGDLAGLGPLDLGYGPLPLPGELVVRIMLHDWDDLEAQARAGRTVVDGPRWDALVGEFRRLEGLIGRHDAAVADEETAAYAEREA
jgi:hypothetical protein